MTQFSEIFKQWKLTATPFAVEALKCDEKGEHLLRGRDDEITQVMRKLHRNGRVTCIDGQYGVGKTSLVNVAIYRCLQAFKKGDTTQILLPCKVAFQLKEDLDIDEFVRKVLYHVVITIKDNEKLLSRVCETTGFDDFHRLINDPVLRAGSHDASTTLTVGIPGVVSANVGGRVASAEAVNTSPGFLHAGFELRIKELLQRLFTSVAGGVVCVIDNIELLETAGRARKTLELLRDRLLVTTGLRWVFCGANGVIHSLAASPRISAFLNMPVLDLANVRTIDLKDLINARIEEYSATPQTTWELLPFGMAEVEWLYEILNFNLRDLMAHLEQYCEHVSSNRISVTKGAREAMFKNWVHDFGQFNYRDISRRISKSAWLILDAAMSDDFKGAFNAGQYDEFNRNSKIQIGQDSFRRWLRDLKKHDIITQSIPEDGDDEKLEVELETYAVTSKGALIFFYRQKAQENLTLSPHTYWLRRVSF